MASASRCEPRNCWTARWSPGKRAGSRYPESPATQSFGPTDYCAEGSCLAQGSEPFRPLNTKVPKLPKPRPSADFGHILTCIPDRTIDRGSCAGAPLPRSPLLFDPRSIQNQVAYSRDAFVSFSRSFPFVHSFREVARMRLWRRMRQLRTFTGAKSIPVQDSAGQEFWRLTAQSSFPILPV